MKHKRNYCPRCGSPKIESTCMGVLPGNIDTNWAMCHGEGCDWIGILEDCKGPKDE
jgi:hypothetical protein